MTYTRAAAPIGSPCWADLWTSDVEGSRRFYAELFGWEAQEPSPEFGGYFMFTRDGVPVAGGMGDMGDMKADNSWKVYLATDDIAKTLETAEAEGAQIVGAGHGGRRPRHPGRAHRPDRRHCGGLAARDLPWVHRPRRARCARAGSSCSPGTTPRRWPSTARCSAGTPTRSATATSSGTRVMRNPSRRRRAGRDHGRRRLSARGLPPHWSVYLEVDDIDATVASGLWPSAARSLRRPRTPPTAAWPR